MPEPSVGVIRATREAVHLDGQTWLYPHAAAALGPSSGALAGAVPAVPRHGTEAEGAGSMADQWRLLKATLDVIDHAAALCDGEARVLMCNGAARDCFARDDGITLKGGRIHISDGLCRQRLLRMLNCAEAAGPRAVMPAAAGMTVPRPSGRLPYQVLLNLLMPNSASATAQGAAAIWSVAIADPARISRPKLQAIASLYHLTPAETRLAHQLMLGATTREAATALGVSVSTIRSQLSTLMRKTDTRRQAQLVRLFGAVPA